MLECRLRHLMAERKIDDISTLMEETKLSRTVLDKLKKEINLETVKIGSLLPICDKYGWKLSELIEYVPKSRIDNKKD